MIKEHELVILGEEVANHLSTGARRVMDMSDGGLERLYKPEKGHSV